MGNVPVVTEDVTASFLTDALRSTGTISDEVAVVDVDHERIGEGVGLMCTIARLGLTYDREAPEAPSSVVIKVPSHLPENRAIGDHFGFYEREGRFYDQVCDTLPVRTPTCYFNHIDPETNEFALLLEDFAGRAMADQVVGISFDRASAAIRALARLHAAWWESDRLDALGWMPRAIDPGIISAGAQYRSAWERFAELFADALPDGAIALGEQVGATWEANQTALFESTPTTICHGDFRSDNLMFDDSTEGRDHVGVLDWQISYRSGGIGDVCYLFTQSMSIEDRRRHERELVEIWYDAICAALGDRPDDYSLEDAWTGYRAAMANLTVYGVVAGGALDPSNERGIELVTEMARRSFIAALDHDAEQYLAG